jgi:transposase-like protein
MEAFESKKTKLQGYALRKARSEGYTRIAKQMFLEGTPYRSPAEAVEMGVKSAQQWCDCLEMARDEFRVNSHIYND